MLHTVLQMIEKDATHIGVATDHVIESFRNGLWPGYKTGEGIEPALFAQFHPLEQALAAMGVAVWPMVELEADDALASAARIAAGRSRACGRSASGRRTRTSRNACNGDRVVQVHRKSKQILDADAVREKFGVEPARIPDFLALVGDTADGYPGIDGIGEVTAARLVNRYGALEDFPPEVLGERRAQALLFKNLATLRTDAALFGDVDELRWRGPADSFAEWVERLGDQRLLLAAPAQHRIKRGQDPFPEKGS